MRRSISPASARSAVPFLRPPCKRSTIAYGDRIPDFYSAIDIAIINNIPSSFSDYCYPQKLNEILACGVPFVAARTSVIEDLLVDHLNITYTAGDATSLEQAVTRILSTGYIPDIQPVFWPDLAKELENYLHDVIEMRKM